MLFAGYAFPYKTLRDGPLEKLCGGGEFLSRRNIFFRYQIHCMNFLDHSMNIFLGLIGVHDFFFHVIFPCANISFFCTSPPPSPSLPPYIVSNGPLYGSRSMYESRQGPEICDVSSAKRYFLSL